MKKIVFMGTPEYARVILEKIINAKKFEISLVLTQPDRPVGRKQELLPSPVKQLATKESIEVMQPNSLKETVVYEALKDIKPDFIVVAAFGQLLPKTILEIAPCINLHASLLPLYRGASPVQQALLNSDAFTGVTAMLMEEGLDSGPMLAFRYFKIPEDMKLDALMDQMSIDAASLTITTLEDFENILPIPQTKALSSHCKKIQKEDGLIALKDAKSIYNKYRAFYGWPGIYLANKLKLLDIELREKDGNYKAGQIIKVEGESVVVGCDSGAIKINLLQPESKKAMGAKAYLVGRGLKIGDSII